MNKLYNDMNTVMSPRFRRLKSLAQSIELRANKGKGIHGYSPADLEKMPDDMRKIFIRGTMRNAREVGQEEKYAKKIFALKYPSILDDL